MTRRLLRLTLLILTGYGIGWADRAYGHTPILLFALIAAVSWLAGAVYAAAPLTAAVATAQRERDVACEMAVSVQEGAAFQAVPVRADTRRLRSVVR